MKDREAANDPSNGDDYQFSELEQILIELLIKAASELEGEVHVESEAESNALFERYAFKLSIEDSGGASFQIQEDRPTLRVVH